MNGKSDGYRVVPRAQKFKNLETDFTSQFTSTAMNDQLTPPPATTDPKWNPFLCSLDWSECLANPHL